MKVTLRIAYCILASLLLFVLAVQGASSATQTPVYKKTFISGRVIEVSADGKTVFINKGKRERLESGSQVVFRYNRGTDNAEVEWDIVLAKGTIASVDDYSSTVKLLLQNDKVRNFDYCEVETELPVALENEDLWRIAKYDIAILDRESGLPFFDLGDLASDPTEKNIRLIYSDLEAEIRSYADSDLEEVTDPEKIKGGAFNGMDVRTALRKTTGEHIRKHVEYVAWYAGSYINFDWNYFDIYVWWIRNGTDSGEAEKRKTLSIPYADEGDEYTEAGKFQEALDSYKEAVRVNPDYAYAKEQIASISNVLKYRKMTEDDPKDTVTLFHLGEEYYNVKLYQRSLETLSAARDLGYEDQNLTKLMGYGYRQLGRFKEAVAVFEKLVAASPDNRNYRKWLAFCKTWASQSDKGETAQSNVALGNLYYEEDVNYDKAAECYNRALELAPGSKEIWSLVLKTSKRKKAVQYENWARDYWARGFFEDAKGYWKNAVDACKAIGDTGSAIKILSDMGLAMNDLGYYDDAIAVYMQVLDMDKKHYDSHMRIANCYTSKGEYAKAALWAEKGMQYNPADAWGNNILGNIKNELGLYDEAIAYLKKSASMNSTYANPLYILAFSYVMKENYDEAAKQCELALAIDTDYSEARSRLVSIRCVQEAKQIIKADPRNAGAYVKLGTALFDLYDYDRAIIALKQATSIDKNMAKAYTYLGYCLIRQGKYRDGRVYLADSIRLNPRADVRSWLLYTDAKLLLAKNPNDPEGYVMLGRDSMYWEDFESALTRFETASGLGADKAVLFTLMDNARKGIEAKKEYDKSTDFYMSSDFEKGMEHARAALDLYVKSGSKKGEFWSLFRIGWCYALSFKHDSALEYYNKARKIADELNEETLLNWYVNSMGDYYNSMGEYEKALELKKRARDMYHASNSLIDEARLALPSMGNLRGVLGEKDLGLSTYEEALTIHRNTSNPKAEASLLIDIGNVYLTDADYSKAIDNYAQSLAISQKYDSRWDEMSAYAALCDAYSILGDFENARKNGERFLESALAIGSKSNRVNALNRMGLTYLENNKDVDKALSYFKECLGLAELIDYTLVKAAATSNIGVCLTRSGKAAEGLQYHNEALAMVVSLKNRYMEMQGLHEKGETLFLLRKFDEALDCQQKALGIAQSLGDKTEQWTYLYSMGKLYEEKGDSAKAIDSYKKITEILSGIKNKLKSEKLMKDFSSQDSQVDAYKRLIGLLVKAGKTEEALRYIEESRSKAIKDAFGDVKPEAQDPNLKETLGNVDRYERKKEAIEKQIQDEKKKPVNEQDATKLGTLAKTLASTEGEFNQWMLKLKFQNAAMYNALTIKPSTLGDIQKDIPPKALILEYFYSETELYVFCISKTEFLARSVAVTQDELAKLVTDYASLCRNPKSLKQKEMPAIGARLESVLIETVSDVISRYETLVVIPFGILHYLPFQALPVVKDGKTEYLVERMRICYTTSATFADVLKGGNKDVSGMMGIGNPDGSLPGSQTEVNAIKERFSKGSSRVLVSQDATKKNFFKLAKDYPIIHLATHGVIQNNPLESYLLFSGKSSEDKRLTLLEIAGYTELRGKNSLVFLSACETAVELVRRNGGELMSLAEAFAMAGTPTLIATLWEVDDASTGKLAVKFYEELMSGRKDKLDSIRAAQISLLKTKEYAHPFYWAPFILLGSWE